MTSCLGEHIAGEEGSKQLNPEELALVLATMGVAFLLNGLLMSMGSGCTATPPLGLVDMLAASGCLSEDSEVVLVVWERCLLVSGVEEWVGLGEKSV